MTNVMLLCIFIALMFVGFVILAMFADRMQSHSDKTAAQKELRRLVHYL